MAGGKKWDPKKAAKTLAERGLLFADAAEVIAGRCQVHEDVRRDYGERRFVAVGPLRGRLVVVFTFRAGEPWIISLRKANRREQATYQKG